MTEAALPPPSPAEEAAARRARWWALALLTALYTLSTVDRNIVSILAEPIRQEFGLNDSQLGFLTGTVFAISFALAGIPLGLLADRTNRVRMLAALLGVWSVLTILSGFTRTYVTLLLARIGVAAAESGASPASMSLITDLFPKEKRGTALGVFYTSTPLGLAIGFALGGVIAAHFGWRAAFFFAGVPGLVISALLILTMREPRRGAQDAPRSGSAALVNSSVGELLRITWRRKTMLFLILAAISMIIAQAGIGAFIAPFLIRVHGMPIDQVGGLVALAWGGGGLFGLPLGGIFADRVAKAAPSHGPRFVALSAVITAPLAMSAFLVSTPYAALALIFAASVVGHAYYGATFSVYLSVAPAAIRGAAGALLIVALNLIGYGVGPQMTGILSDLFAHAGIANSLRWALVAAASVYFIAALFFVLASFTVARDQALEEGSTP
jgi:predicted MFS family arabinose efflux permease